MNIFHHWCCNSKGWARSMHQYMPMMLSGIELGDDLIEIGPGPGVTTDWLRERVARLTAVEIDSGLAKKLRQRMDGANVTVIEGDATKMSLPDSSFSGAVCFTMLHHVPAAELQDRLLAEACRVLRPGGTFAGSDSTPSLRWNLLHVFDTRVPCDPETFPRRLEAAGFTDVSVRTYPGGFSFRAKKPSP
jgi:ubiquinone/menaquinone biosynthesis C-methylase UbiE